jgi:hypothetical protein
MPVHRGAQWDTDQTVYFTTLHKMYVFLKNFMLLFGILKRRFEKEKKYSNPRN